MFSHQLEIFGKQQGGNKMLQKSNLRLLGLLFAVTLPIQQAQAALFEPTGGNLHLFYDITPTADGISPTGIHSSTDVTLSRFSLLGGPNSFSAAPVQGQGAELTVAVGPDFFPNPPRPDRLSVSGSAIGGFSSGGTGQIGFDLTAAAPLRFLFSSIPADRFLGFGAVTLFKDTPTGSQLLGCSGDLFLGDFCSIGSGTPPQGSAQGLLTLAAGHYELLFNVHTEHGGGITEPGNLSFSLTPVPVPAGIWLLGSVLAGLLSFLRRKTA